LEIFPEITNFKENKKKYFTVQSVLSNQRKTREKPKRKKIEMHDTISTSREIHEI
jgi:hypothetical protein